MIQTLEAFHGRKIYCWNKMERFYSSKIETRCSLVTNYKKYLQHYNMFLTLEILQLLCKTIRRMVNVAHHNVTILDPTNKIDLTNLPFGRDMSPMELWLALRDSHKCHELLAGPSGHP